MAKTRPDVFIIESLKLSDELKNRFEGRILQQILLLGSEKQVVYYYIRTKRELKEIVKIFEKTGCRYLHLSCHGNTQEMATTLDTITFADLASILNPVLHGRRVFLSACQMACEALAQRLLPNTGCHSVIGPAEDVTFGDAALLWASFYHLMFKTNERAMKRADVKKHLHDTSRMFGVRMSYFAASEKSSRGFQSVNLAKGAT